MRWLLTMAILVSAVQAACADDLPIDVYDLTGALQFDATNPTETARVWDHVHAIATLQGIVNRDSPRLYVRFVRAGGRKFILFYVGDWDSAAWVQQQMPVVWDPPDRSKTRLMW